MLQISSLYVFPLAFYPSMSLLIFVRLNLSNNVLTYLSSAKNSRYSLKVSLSISLSFYSYLSISYLFIFHSSDFSFNILTIFCLMTVQRYLGWALFKNYQIISLSLPSKLLIARPIPFS